MYEFEIINVKTDEVNILFGTSYARACEKAGIDPNDWICTYAEYID